jgi:hypothetical protein
VVTNFTESFQDTLDRAPVRKAEAEARLKAAEAELAAEDAAGRKAIEKRIQAARGDPDAGGRDARHALGAARRQGQEGDLRARA